MSVVAAGMEENDSTLMPVLGSPSSDSSSESYDREAGAGVAGFNPIPSVRESYPGVLWEPEKSKVSTSMPVIAILLA